MQGFFFLGPDPGFPRQFPKKEEKPMPLPFNGFSVFDDKGEVKRLVEHLIRERDPDVMIECLRRLDFSYIFTLTKREKTTEVELTRPEIDGSWNW
jgi:hypothetical protein